MSKVYGYVTEKVLGMLAEGTVPWKKMWQGGAGSFPVSVHGRRYRGINVFMLSIVGQMKGYTSPVWLTYKQAVALGGKVTPGEKGTMVTFWKQLQVDDPDKPGKKKTIPFLRYYTVFNTEQTEGCTFPKGIAALLVPADPADDFDPIAEAELIFESMPNRPSVAYDGGDRAYYVPALDSVHLPKRESFHSPAAFYDTAFHELGHATGHESRLNRRTGDENLGFGSHDYGREELVAEMTSAFLCATAGIEQETLTNAAAYINSWMKTIKEDEKMVVWAAGKAQAAADHILGVTPEYTKKETN